MTIFLVNGSKLPGHKQSFDAYVVYIALSTGSQAVFMHAIATIGEDRGWVGGSFGNAAPSCSPRCSYRCNTRPFRPLACIEGAGENPCLLSRPPDGRRLRTERHRLLDIESTPNAPVDGRLRAKTHRLAANSGLSARRQARARPTGSAITSRAEAVESRCVRRMRLVWHAREQVRGNGGFEHLARLASIVTSNLRRINLSHVVEVWRRFLRAASSSSASFSFPSPFSPYRNGRNAALAVVPFSLAV